MKNKFLIGAIIVLAGVLIFENAYLLGRRSKVDNISFMHQRYEQKPRSYLPDLIIDVNRMQERMRRMFSDEFLVMPVTPNIGFDQTVVSEGIIFDNKVNAYLVKVNIPGVKKEDIDIQIKDRQLIIAAGLSKDKTSKDKENYVREYNYGNYWSSFLLPEDIMIKNVTSDYQNGILIITIPRKEIQKEKRPAAVKVSVK